MEPPLSPSTRRKPRIAGGFLQVNLRDRRPLPERTIVVTAFLGLVIGLSLLFIYSDGFQVGSCVPASAIGSRALRPVHAVLLAAAFEFAGAMLGGSAVAESVTAITDWPARADLLPVLASGLVAAVAWNYATKALALPSSSTHAVFGGILGSVVAGAGGSKYVVWGSYNHLVDATGVWKVGLSLLLSPFCGLAAGYLIQKTMNLLLWRATTRVNKPIKMLQWATVAVLAFSHGANDSQKAMGIIMLALFAAGHPEEAGIPLWVRLSCGTAIALGVLALAPALVKRVGTRIYRLRPLHGLTSQVASASVILTASLTGGPVSTTQVVSSSVMGAGSADRAKGVHWPAAREMYMAWLLTLPAVACLGAAVHLIAFRWLVPALMAAAS